MNKFQKVVKVFAICLGIVIIVNICALILSVFSIGVHIENNNENLKSFEETYEGVEKIELDSVASNITIKQGEQFKIEANTKNGITSKFNNETLYIEEKTKFFSNSGLSGEIIIYVPANLNLRELKIDSGAGKLDIDSISSSSFDIDHGAGTLKISNSNFDKVDIDGGAGAIEIKSSNLNNLDFDAGVGKIDIEANITGNSKISAGVGEINITLFGREEDYKINTEKGIGSIKINGVQYNSSTSYGTGVNYLEVEGGMGAINIDFKNE